MIVRFLLPLLLLLGNQASYAQATYQYTAPKALEDGWAVADLREKGMQTKLIELFIQQINKEKHQLHSMLVVQDQTILLEHYWGTQSQATQHDLRSATKSITSLLVGIAIDKGFINSIDDKIGQYLTTSGLKVKKCLDPRKADITIKNLITMSSGLDCNDWDRRSKGQEDKVYKKRNWLQYFLDLPMLHDPGTQTSYCTMGQILAVEIVSQATGMPIDVFAQQYLFEPLGIEEVSWGHTSKRKDILPSGKRLYMRSRDLAKIGQLLLHKGQWQGQQVVSEAWVATSTKTTKRLSGLGYGFLWWNIPFEVAGTPVLATAAMGNGGQYIFVFPDFNLVAIFTGAAYNSKNDKLPFAILKDIILPTFVART